MTELQRRTLTIADAEHYLRSEVGIYGKTTARAIELVLEALRMERIHHEYAARQLKNVCTAVAPLCDCDLNPDTTGGPERDCPIHGDYEWVAEQLREVVRRQSFPEQTPVPAARPAEHSGELVTRSYIGLRGSQRVTLIYGPAPAEKFAEHGMDGPIEIDGTWCYPASEEIARAWTDEDDEPSEADTITPANAGDKTMRTYPEEK